MERKLIRERKEKLGVYRDKINSQSAMGDAKDWGLYPVNKELLKDFKKKNDRMSSVFLKLILDIL